MSISEISLPRAKIAAFGERAGDPPAEREGEEPTPVLPDRNGGAVLPEPSAVLPSETQGVIGLLTESRYTENNGGLVWFRRESPILWSPPETANNPLPEAANSLAATFISALTISFCRSTFGEDTTGL